ncbi:metal ABC transporter permease [Micropruina glycogenica]|uniref:metal ABC transporter permease n=1 Tax=Micropruina glycogenica TaxID=75385 RepID=UPI001E4F8ADB|nr:metal ABC transporter permease [Micropruina glycogenica]
MYRCLASVDRAVAAGRGVPTRALSIIVMLLLGVTVAVAVQIVGALLVLFLLVTPGRGLAAGLLLALGGADAQRHLRRHRQRRWHPPRPRQRHPDQSLHHHYLLPHLPRLSTHRRKSGRRPSGDSAPCRPPGQGVVAAARLEQVHLLQYPYGVSSW